MRCVELTTVDFWAGPSSRHAVYGAWF